MDIFEKFLLRDSQLRSNDKNLRTSINYELAPEGLESEEEPIRVGGRPGLKRGTTVNFVRVIGQNIKAGRLSKLSNREYNVECIAPKGEGECGKKFVATYHQIYYQSVYSCGCVERLKHPPIMLERKQIGVLEVIRWDEQQGWECVCRECGELLYAKKVGEVRALGMRCPPHKKG